MYVMYGALVSSPIYTGFIVAILLNSSLMAFTITQVRAKVVADEGQDGRCTAQ
jgi:hypothetical protein